MNEGTKVRIIRDDITKSQLRIDTEITATEREVGTIVSGPVVFPECVWVRFGNVVLPMNPADLELI